MRAALITLLFVSVTALPSAGEPDHERARRALESGEIVPLSVVLSAVEREFEGQVIEVELEREDGKWVYEIELLTKTDNVLELTYDARTVKLIEWEGRDVDAARKKP